jgi:ribosomal-protein-alanine N-acetyltransferase
MIRPFRFSDFEPLLDLEAQSFPKSPYDLATFISLYQLHGRTFWVYLEADPPETTPVLLGYLIIHPDGHLISLAVHPRHRRKGIGRALLDRARETVGSGRLWAEVRESNRGAQAFYTRMGFRVVGRIVKYYGTEDALIIERKEPEPK